MKIINNLPQQIEQNKKRQARNLDNGNRVSANYVAKNQPNFGNSFYGLLSVPQVFLRFLDTNQAWGANAVDLGSMVIPRTAYDLKNRGLAAGLETGRREATGTANHASVGIYGTVAGMAIAAAMGLKANYGIKAHKIFANNETLNILGDKWYKALHSGSEDVLKTYLNSVADDIKVYNPSNENAVENMVSLSKETKDKFVAKVYDLLKNGKKDTIQTEDTNYLKSIITADTGGEKSVVLNGFFKGKSVQADNSLSTLIENIHNVTKAYNTEKVINSFKEAANVDEVKVLKALKKLNISRSAAGLGIASAIGMSVQPINMYLTRKKTGCDGFPGVPGRKQDKSLGFKIKKTIAALLFSAAAISTIMVGDKKAATKELNKVLTNSEKLKAFGNKFLAKIQFKGKMPTINQLKFVYGMTIMSRLLCARDNDELRESAVKDSLGFLNLLILGSLVTKGATRLFNKELINVAKGSGKGFMNWMKNSSVKSRDEILLSALKKHGVSVTENGKALSYFKLLGKIGELPKEVATKLRKELMVLDLTQLIGYAYSGIFLGYYLPNLNDKMSKANEEKRIAKLAQAEGKTIEQVKQEMEIERKKMEDAMANKNKRKDSNTQKTETPSENKVQSEINKNLIADFKNYLQSA